jgi:catechol 2,3-dioxygenase-like lactoylglutathione lyase family enzyme
MMVHKPELERWKRIDEIFHAAESKTPSERRSYLDNACAGDDELRREIESLLAYRKRAADFLTTSALELIVDTSAHDGSRPPFPDVLTALFESDLETEGGSQLRVTTPSGAIKTVALDQDSISVGRAETNQLAFPEDDGLSREHALIELGDDGWTVRDLGSRNGTLVNGKKLEKGHLLRCGDRISASCITLTYLDAAKEGG